MIFSSTLRDVYILGSARKYAVEQTAQAKSLAADPARGVAVFPDDLHASITVGTTPFHQAHLSVTYLSQHIPDATFIIITEQPEQYKGYASERYTVIERETFIEARAETSPELASFLNCNDKSFSPYPPHLTRAQVDAGIASRDVGLGTLRASRFTPFNATVSTQLHDQPIHIVGRQHMNRAIDGDTVAVRLLPEAEWRRPAPVLDEADASDTTLDDLPSAQPSGVVVYIDMNRTKVRYCGSIDPDTIRGDSVIFRPITPNIPSMRLLRPRSGKGAPWAGVIERRIIVQVDTWDVAAAYPRGVLVGEVGATSDDPARPPTHGQVGDVWTESEVILLEHGIRHFPLTAQDLLNCLPPEDYYTSDMFAEERARRPNLETRPICSVDPPGCVDIDDALHYMLLDDIAADPAAFNPWGQGYLGRGLAEVGVHIADVSHFVHPGSAIDAEAQLRCTSVYFAEKRIDMLPALLTTDVCSLHDGAPRLAFSALFLFDPQTGKTIAPPFFAKSVIRSVSEFSYDNAQKLMEKDDARMAADAAPAPLYRARASLRGLWSIALQLRDERRAAGALTLASSAVKFTFNECDEGANCTDYRRANRVPAGVGEYHTKDTHSLVEEFMLLANIAVARRIWQAFPGHALLRLHPPPAPTALDDLNETLSARYGVTLQTGSNLQLARSLEEVEATLREREAQTRATGRGKVFDAAQAIKHIKILVTRCMSLAMYFSSGAERVGASIVRADPDNDTVPDPMFAHYGLASEIYTHFTSPIRRYADLVVHRLLYAAVDGAALPNDHRESEKLQTMAVRMNDRKKHADDAGRDSYATIVGIMFRNAPNMTRDVPGCILSVRKNGLVVMMPDYGIQGQVKITGATYDPKDGALAWRDVKLHVFDTVTVRPRAETTKSGQIRMVVELVEPTGPEVASRRRAVDAGV